jgi:uncharacterized protein (DUF362 family)
MTSHVYVIKGTDPAAMAHEAISKAFKENAAGKSVLLKVNTGFKGPAASGLCTHPEVVRGLIRFFKEKHVGRLYVGDSSIVGTDSMEALKSAGIHAVCLEEGAECVSLDDFGMQEVRIPDPVMVDSLKLSRLPFQVDILVSVPVMKTHMYTGATLGIKNMKGCMYQKDKTRLHRIHRDVPDSSKGKCLDYGIMDLAKVCYPDYTVADGFIAMEGFGPSGGTPVNLGVVVASDNAVANDLVCLRLMGMGFDAVPHINLVRENKGFDLRNLRVHPENYMDYSRKFVLATEHDLHQSYSNPRVVDRGACSACHAAMVQFFRYHHHEFADWPPVTVGIGRDLERGDLLGGAGQGGSFEGGSSCDVDVPYGGVPEGGTPGDAGQGGGGSCGCAPDGRVIVVGNCTARHRKDFPFCKGCPPVASQIARTIKEGKTLDD